MLRCRFCRQLTPDDRLWWIPDFGYYCSSACAWAWISVLMLSGSLDNEELGSWSYPTMYDHFTALIKETWGA